jgi:hypothetical protein
LMKTNPYGAAALGVISLPVAAFFFGMAVSWIQLLVEYMTGAFYRFVQPRFAPVSTGLQFARGILLPCLGAFLVPLSALSTWYLQCVLESQRRGAPEWPHLQPPDGSVQRRQQ